MSATGLATSGCDSFSEFDTGFGPVVDSFSKRSCFAMLKLVTLVRQSLHFGNCLSVEYGSITKSVLHCQHTLAFPKINSGVR